MFESSVPFALCVESLKILRSASGSLGDKLVSGCHSGGCRFPCSSVPSNTTKY